MRPISRQIRDEASCPSEAPHRIVLPCSSVKAVPNPENVFCFSFMDSRRSTMQVTGVTDREIVRQAGVSTQTV